MEPATDPSASLSAHETALARNRVSPGAVWGMLLARSGLALTYQCLFALGFWLAGSRRPWRQAADWWLGWLILVNVTCLGLLIWLMRQESLGFWQMLIPRRRGLGKDLSWLMLALVLSGPIGFLPNILIGRALWGNAQVGADLIFRALPVWGAYVLLAAFPITHALAELATYFGYVMPRLQALTGRRWQPLLNCAAALAAQHVFLPLLFDWRFVLWRLLMFAPFALWVGFVVDRRPTVLPYLAITHGLLDASLPLLILRASIRGM